MRKNVLCFVVFSFVLIVIGIIFSFIDLNKLSIKLENSQYVGAIFSLAGVILFFAALLYQIEEYKVQVEELKKSVEAQTNSSKALDDQKDILLRQNSNSMIFGMINNFNNFKENNDIHKILSVWCDKYKSLFYDMWKDLSHLPNINESDFHSQFAKNIKDILNKTVTSHDKYFTVKKYVLFFQNLLIMIEDYSSSQNIFKPFLFSQLNSQETLMIYLLNLVDSNMPTYKNLPWNYETTLELIALMKKRPSLAIELKEIDCKTLTQEFEKIRPR